MKINLLNVLHSYLQHGDNRTVKIKKNISLSFIYKILSVLINFFLVPITLGLLDTATYGVWLTIYSIVGWMNIFDLGFGNGMRNQLTIALSLNDLLLSKQIISTTYFLISAIIILLLSAYIPLSFMLDWESIFNYSLADNIQYIMIIIPICFGLRFILKLVGIVHISNQSNSFNDFILFTINATILLTLLIYSAFFNGSLFMVAIIYSLVPLIVYIIFTFSSFNGKFSSIRPSLHAINMKLTKKLTNLGTKFFVIQLSGLFLFTATNIIIIQLSGPVDVAKYNIVYKFYNIVIVGFSVILVPFWAAFSDAYVKKDFNWISIKMKYLNKIFFLSVIFVVAMTILSKWFLKVWIGTNIEFDLILPALLGVYAISKMWNMIYIYFINATGKILLQLIISIIQILLLLPIIYLFAIVFNLGLNGIVLSSVLIYLILTILMPIQVKKLLKEEATGLWNK